MEWNWGEGALAKGEKTVKGHKGEEVWEWCHPCLEGAQHIDDDDSINTSDWLLKLKYQSKRTIHF